MKTLITDKLIRATRPSERRFEIWDSIVPGMVFRISPDGRRTWSLRVYLPDKRRRRISLGTYPEMGVKAARDAARRKLYEASEQDGADGMTFGELADLYMRLYARVRKKSWEEDERKLEVYVLPHWKDKAIDSIGITDVATLLDGVAARGLVMADRVRVMLSTIFNFAIGRGLLAANPAAAVPKRAKEKPRERVLSVDEIGPLWQAWVDDRSLLGCAHMLWLLTAVRRTELLEMPWDELDLDSGLWTIPGERTKNGREHRVFLSRQALGIFEDLHSLRTSTFVFPNKRDSHRPMTSSLTVPKKRFSRMSGVDGWTQNDLRRTAATLVGQIGHPPHVVQRCLNHTPAGVTERVYQRYRYDEEAREAWQALADHLETVVGPISCPLAPAETETALA